MAFILVAFGGSYDDAWQNNVAVSTDEAAITALKVKKESEREILISCSKKLNEFVKEWEKKNPFDSNLLEKTANLPKWPSGIDQRMITKEMRSERESICAYNNGVNDRNRAQLLAHNKLRIDAEHEICEELGLFNVLDRSLFANSFITHRLYQFIDVQYQIEEIEEI